MLKRSIGTRYAKALFELARDTDRLDAVEKDFPPLLRMIEEEPGLRRFLTHPAIGSGEKKEIAAKLLRGSVDNLLFDFINLIIDKKREVYLPIIGEEFNEFLMEYRAMRTAMIYTAFALSAEVKQALARGLSKMTGRTVEIVEEIEPALIGGIKVQIGDKVYDGSISDRLSHIREELLSAKV